jgi:DNA-binding GntR family transcriptional regulator
LNTIRQAQQLLVDDGMVETRQGVGSFVFAHRAGAVAGGRAG